MDNASSLCKVFTKLSLTELCYNNDWDIMQVAEQRREVIEENRYVFVCWQSSLTVVRLRKPKQFWLVPAILSARFNNILTIICDKYDFDYNVSWEL